MSETGRPFYVAVDFDGTIVEHRFPEVGPFIPGAVESLLSFQEAGASLILWTMRSDGHEHGDVLSQAVAALAGAGVVMDFVNENPQPWTSSPKAYAHVYIDDSAIGCPLVSPRDPVGNHALVVNWNAVRPYVLALIAAVRGA